MTKATAMQILGVKILTLSAIKTQRGKAAIKFHPDKAGEAGLEVMKNINLAYSYLKELIEKFGEDSEPFESSDDNDSETFSDDIQQALDAIITLEGLEIEVCGIYIWVGGDTKTHKDALKAAGYWWASKKFKWYWKPADYKSKGRGQFDMDKIRDMHGSKEVKSKSFQAIK